VELEQQPVANLPKKGEVLARRRQEPAEHQDYFRRSFPWFHYQQMHPQLKLLLME
jgi:hypothetical protein